MMLALIVMDILNIFNLENRRRREKQLSLTHLMGCHVRQGTCTEIMVKTNRGSCRAQMLLNMRKNFLGTGDT